MASSSPRVFFFKGRDRDGLRVVPIQDRESQELRSGRHVGIVGRIVDGHDHGPYVPCGLGVQLDCVGASAAFFNR